MEFDPVHPEDLGEKPPIEPMVEFMVNKYLRDAEEDALEHLSPVEFFDDARKFREEEVRRYLGYMGQ